MEKNKFAEWDSMYNAKELKNTAEEAAKNEFKEVEPGKYTVKLEKLELGETGAQSKRPGSPMAKGTLKIQEGKFKNQNIFLNFLLIPNDEGKNFGLHRCNEFLKSLDTGIDVEFNGFADYADLLMDIKEEVDRQKLYYEIEYTVRNGFGSVKVLEVFEE